MTAYRLGIVLLILIYGAFVWRDLEHGSTKLTYWSAMAVRAENPQGFWTAITIHVGLLLVFLWGLVDDIISN